MRRSEDEGMASHRNRSGANRVVRPGRYPTPVKSKYMPPHGQALGMHRRPAKFVGAHPPTPAPECQSQKASYDDKALQTRESRRMLRIAGQAESELRRAREDLKILGWIEFKPSRGMRSTRLNRSSRSSNDLKARNVADRTVAVALSWCAPL